MKKNFDLLSTVEQGGCSAKLPAGLLGDLLKRLHPVSDPNLLVHSETHDDAGVYRLDPETALIFTTDFFPPVCSDPFEFGEIAAANALSDIYAMGGKPLLALNLMMFSHARIPLHVLEEILRGGQEKAREAGTLIIGGHTIDDHPPKYGLAVIGTVHPDHLVTNAGARPGDRLVLTKAIGTGALVAGHENGITREEDYRRALEQMKSLNMEGASCGTKYGIRGMTDITGFGLAGHGLKMAEASGVSLRIKTAGLPILPGAFSAFEKGSIPGAAFSNWEFTGDRIHFTRGVDHSTRMLVHDAQTSGGLLIAVSPDLAESLVDEVANNGSPQQAVIIGEVLEKSPREVYFE
jgi:selenide,water dikinase